MKFISKWLDDWATNRYALLRARESEEEMASMTPEDWAYALGDAQREAQAALDQRMEDSVYPKRVVLMSNSDGAELVSIDLGHPLDEAVKELESASTFPPAVRALADLLRDAVIRAPGYGQYRDKMEGELDNIFETYTPQWFARAMWGQTVRSPQGPWPQFAEVIDADVDWLKHLEEHPSDIEVLHELLADNDQPPFSIFEAVWKAVDAENLRPIWQADLWITETGTIGFWPFGITTDARVSEEQDDRIWAIVKQTEYAWLAERSRHRGQWFLKG